MPENPQRLRIAVLHRIFVSSGGGAERYAMSLVEHLSLRHEIHVFAQEIAHQHPGVTYHKISAPLKRPRWINQLWYATASWWATRHGFDVVHSHENTWHGNVQTVHVLPVWHNFFAGRTGLKLGLRWLKALTSPRMWTYLGLESLRFALPKPGAIGMPGRFLVVTSDTLRVIMERTFPRSVTGLRVISPGVELPPRLESHEAKRAVRDQARQRLGIPLDAPCVLLVGNDFARKGLPSLLLAMLELPANACLLAVGSAQRIPEFRAQAERLGLKGRVIFHGAMKDISVAYRAADVLAHPTLEDTFAMVVLEAMAHHLPVVVSGSKYCGISAMLTDGVDAMLLPDPQDHAAIARSLNAVLDQAELKESLASNAAEFAEKHTWAVKARTQELMYLELQK